MKKLIIFLCLGLMGCPGGLQSRNDIKTADGRFDSSDGPSRATSGRMSTPKAAEQASDYQNLLEEVRRLNGQVEELQHRMQMSEQNKNQENLAQKVDALEKRLISFSETLLLFESHSFRSSFSNTTNILGPKCFAKFFLL